MVNGSGNILSNYIYIIFAETIAGILLLWYWRNSGRKSTVGGTQYLFGVQSLSDLLYVFLCSDWNIFVVLVEYSG